MNHSDRDGEKCGGTHWKGPKIHTLDWVSQHTIPDIREQYVPRCTDHSEEHEQCKVDEEERKGEQLHDLPVATVWKAMREDGNRPSPCNTRKLSVNLYAGQVDFARSREHDLGSFPYLSRSPLSETHSPIVTANQAGVKCLLRCTVTCVSITEEKCLPYYISPGSLTAARSLCGHGGH